MKKIHLWCVLACLFLIVLCNSSGTAQTIQLYAGSGGSLGDGGQATAANLANPTDMFVDASGNMYVADKDNNRIRKISSSGIITTIAGTGAGTPSADGAIASAASISNPTSLVMDASGNIYFAENGNNKIRKIDASTGVMTTVAGNGSGSGGATADGLQATASNISPSCVRLDGSGNLYFTCGNTYRLRRVDLATGIVTTVAGNGTWAASGNGVEATSCGMEVPYGIAIDVAGNIYISQVFGNKISLVTTDGNIYTAAGDGGSGYDMDGWGLSRSVTRPGLITIKADGTILIPEGGGSQRIRKLDMSAGFTFGYLSLVAGSADAYADAGDGGPATAATFYLPSAVTTDAAGDIYVSTFGNRIRKINASCTPPSIGPASSMGICRGSNTAFTATSVVGTTYTWAPATALSATTGASVTASPTVATTYTVTAVRGTCTTTATASVSILSTPNDITGNTPICSAQTMALNCTPAGGNWSSSNSNASVNATGLVTGNIAGTSVITYMLPSTSCFKTTIVTINALPTITIGGTTTVPEGTTTTLTASGATSYSWSPATNLSATTDASVTVTPYNTIVYTVTGTSGSCAAAVTVTVTGTPAASDNIWTFAGGGVSFGDGGPATAAQLTLPGAISIDAGGNKYIAEGEPHHRIRKVTPAGIITTIAGNGTAASAPDGTAATAAAVNRVVGITTDAAGNIYFSEGDNARIRKIDAVTGLLSTVAGTGTSSGPATADGIQATATNLYPFDVRFVAPNYLYVVDGNSMRLRKIDLSTGIISTIAGNGTMGYSGEGVVATASGLMLPFSLALDASGDVYISQYAGNRISVVRPDGRLYTVAGNGLNTAWFDGDGIATAKQLANPYFISIDNSDNLLVASPYAGRVRKIDLSTGIMTTIAGNGDTTIDAGDGGPATAASFRLCTNAVRDAAGYTYVSSVYGNRVRVIGPPCTPPVINSISSSGSICLGGTYSLSATATGTTDFNWSPAAGLSGTTGADVTASPTVTTTYTLTAGIGLCAATATVTVSANSTVSITGTTQVCVGATTSLNATVGGGNWTSSNANASVSSSGVVTGNIAGTSVITYLLPSGCYALATVTINAVPTVSAGTNTTVCEGVSTTLNGTGATTYTWLPATGLSATTGATVSATLTTTTTYTLTGTTAGCSNTATKTVSVNALPLVSAGANTSICEGLSAALTGFGATAYAWSPSTGLSATTGAGVTATPTITTTYTLSGTDGNGCVNTATQVITVLPFAVNATGGGTICDGSNTTLSASGATSYTWLPATNLSATTGATVNANPSSTITYTVTGTDGTCTQQKTVTVSVNPLAAITGTTVLCRNTTVTLSCAVGDGVWTSSHVNASVIGSSGVVTGSAAGTANITYTAPGGCYSTVTVTVNELPTVSAGSGAIICQGASTSMIATGAATYVWSPSTALAATTGASVVASPTATTTYTVSGTDVNGCINTASKTITVTPFSFWLSQSKAICPASSDTLNASGTTSYTWLPADGLSATTGATVTASPTITTTYTVTGTDGTCASSKLVTISIVSPMVEVISGTTSICKNATTTLSSSLAGGTWSSGATAVATIGSATGLLSGVSGGTASITYTTPGCSSVKEVTIVATPPITGVGLICTGAVTTLTNLHTGGTWTKSLDTFATVNSTTGAVAGVNPGVTTITYTPATGCGEVTTQVTVGVPPAIEGDGVWACLGGTVDMNHPIAGGTWSTSNPARATVDATTGVVTGISLGNFYLTYTLASGCYRTLEMAVQTHSLPIAGTFSVCPGSSTLLSMTNSAVPGGAWSASDPSVVNVSTTTGTIIGLAAGTSVITYSFHGCYNTQVFTVNTMPADITGSGSVCIGNTITFTSASGGGTWSSSAPSIATIDATTGVITGIVSGSSTITYTAATGCRKTKAAFVNTPPGALSGTLLLCAGNTTSINAASGGNTWSSANTAVGTVVAAMGWGTTFTALAAGTTTITATNEAGCTRTTVVTVNASLPAITGAATVCPGGTMQLANASPGGNWSSSVTARATINSTGLVTAVAAGTSIITYATATCFTTLQISVNSTPGVISGATALCVGNATTLTHADAGGTWVSSMPSRASIDATSGVVTGVSAGAVTITYNVNASCYRTAGFTVNAAPAAITGTTSVCKGATTVLSNATTGGSWSSSNTTIANVPSSPANVYGVNAGMATITYMIPATGCYVTQQVTVNALPSAITGAGQFCSGSSEAYSCLPGGGTWVSSTPSVGSVDNTTGIATAITVGTTTLTYTTPSTFCRATRVVTVVALPGAISGATTVCAGNTVMLTSTTPYQTWTSTVPSKATVSFNSTMPYNGTVSGLSAGVTTISYTNANGCARTLTITVNAAVPDISGDKNVCPGRSIPLANSLGGGTWSTEATFRASINSSGVVTAAYPGTVAVSYTISEGCYNVAYVTVNLTPADISGPTSVCPGSTIDLDHARVGGIWASASANVSVNPANGFVTGVTAGTSIITYNINSGCIALTTVTINSLPAAISGTMTLPVGGTATLTNATPGGVWSSSAPGKATVGLFTGVLSGVSAGIATITYRVSATSCYVTSTATIAASRQALPTVAGESGSGILIYPNPSAGRLVVEAAVNGVFTLYTIDGKQVQQYRTEAPQTSVQLPATLAAGVYTCYYEGVDGSTQIVRIVYAP